MKAWRETRVTLSFKRFIRHVKLFAKSHVSRRVKTRLLQERVVLLLLLLLLLLLGAAKLIYPHLRLLPHAAVRGLTHLRLSLIHI